MDQLAFHLTISSFIIYTEGIARKNTVATDLNGNACKVEYGCIHHSANLDRNFLTTLQYNFWENNLEF